MQHKAAARKLNKSNAMERQHERQRNNRTESPAAEFGKRRIGARGREKGGFLDKVEASKDQKIMNS